MPSRNVLRQDADHSYYHIYARGISKKDVFRDPSDKDYFLYLLSRHLSAKQLTGKKGHTYPHFRGKVELLSYCLMDNHFHLLFYQIEKGALSKLIKSIVVAYTMYFNRKYQRTGPVFEGRFRASRIGSDTYLLHVSRYIHLNPRSWKSFPYSSFRHIIKATEPEWLQSEKIVAQHQSRKAYLEFVADYEAHKQMLDELKHELANL